MTFGLWRTLKESFSSGITRKYVFLFLVILIVPIMMIYNIIIGYAHHIMEDEIEKKNILSVEALTKRLNTEIMDVVLQLQLIAGQKNEATFGPTLMFGRAQQTIAKSSVIQSIFFVDLNQRVLFEAPFLPEMNEPYIYPKFNEVQWSLNYAVSELILNYSHEEVVTVAVPYIYQNRFGGVLVAELSKKYLSEVLKSNSLTRDGFGFILDHTGIVLASTQESEIGKDYSSHPVGMKLSRYYSGSLRGTYQEKTSIIAYHTLKDQWGLGLGIPEKIAFEPVSKLSLALTLSFTGVLLFILFLIILGTRNILYPIVRLTHFAKSFNELQSIQQIESVKVSRDELGSLMKSMISMGKSNLEKQRMLEEKERYLRDVIEGNPYAIVTIDNYGVVSHWNHKFEKLIGYSDRSIEGKHLSQLPIKNGLTDFIALHTLQSDLPTEEKESYIIDSNKQKHIVKIITSKLYNERKEMIGIIAVLQDITQIKQLEEHVKQSEKLAMVGQITTGIAHEIKNPLAILSGASELLKEEVTEHPTGGIIQELSNDIYQVVRRMNGIVNDFLSLAKMKEEQMEFIRLDQLIDKVVHLLRIKLNEAKIQVFRHYDAIHKQIQGNHDKLFQVFLNVILNSIEVMPSGGMITIRMKEKNVEQGSFLIVEITDTGPGIRLDDLDWLFNPFFSTKENGSGLGLTIARDIVMEQGGDIQIQNAASHGATIRCIFPIVNDEGCKEA
jgi:PAS domain S-box-containing protein